MGKLGHFKHVINFKTEKELKMKFSDFLAFQNKMQVSSHDKIIFHMLFRAFRITPRNIIFLNIEKVLLYLGILWTIAAK